MVSMDPKTAVVTYQYGERAKSELIICSQLELALAGFAEGERAGGRRMLVLFAEGVRAEIEYAARATGLSEFRKAADIMSEVISLTESDQFGAASLRVSEAISASTTAAQNAWQVLSDHGLI